MKKNILRLMSIVACLAILLANTVYVFSSEEPDPNSEPGTTITQPKPDGPIVTPFADPDPIDD